jgi:hypothetical protein
VAWEWVAPVATATAGVTGVFFTWLAGKQGREHAASVSANQLANARLLAIDTRQQQRLENAYLQLLEEAEKVGNWAQLVYPFFETNPPQPVPDLPTLEDQAKTAALVKAFGSDNVSRRMEAWRKVVLEEITQARIVGMSEARGQDAFEARVEIDRELRPKEKETRQAIADQVAKELRATYQLTPIADPNAFPWKTQQDD